MWKQACDAYAWSSFDPEIRGETDIMIYGEELHNDLQLMQEEKTGYIHRRLPEKAIRPALGPLTLRQPDGDGTGRIRLPQAGEYEQKLSEPLRGSSAIGGKRFLKPPDGKMKPHDRRKKNWKRHGRRSKRDIKSSADTIHGIDTGQCRGYNRALFVSSILNKVSTLPITGKWKSSAERWTSSPNITQRVKKPVITQRNRFFQLPELAERMREKTESGAKPGKQESAVRGRNTCMELWGRPPSNPV